MGNNLYEKYQFFFLRINGSYNVKRCLCVSVYICLMQIEKIAGIKWSMCGKDRAGRHGLNMFNIKYIYVQKLENRKFLTMRYKR